MLEKDVFPKLAKQGKLRGFPIAGQWFDIGNLDRYETAKKKWKGVSVYEDIE
jgi:NDP-sugar pyrophosphorylase family protein